MLDLCLYTKEERSKLDEKALPCIFISYGDKALSTYYGTQKRIKSSEVDMLSFFEDQIIMELLKL